MLIPKVSILKRVDCILLNTFNLSALPNPFFNLKTRNEISRLNHPLSIIEQNVLKNTLKYQTVSHNVEITQAYNMSILVRRGRKCFLTFKFSERESQRYIY